MSSVKSKSFEGPVRSVEDLARYLNISGWTVSRAINGHPEVKAATRKRVLQAMQDTGFRPNPMARALRGKGTGLVGICVQDLAPQSVAKIAALEGFLHSHGLRTVLAKTEQQMDPEVNAIKDFLHFRVDSMVLVYSILAPAQAAELLKGVMHVFVDPSNTHTGVNIRVDRTAAMSQIFEHLLGLGHTDFGLLGIVPRDVWRYPGMLLALKRHGLDPDRAIQYFEGQQGEERGFALGERFAGEVLALRRPPTALVAINDLVALGCTQTLIARGASVPGQFSVTGFDNLELARLVRPSITTVDQCPRQLMELAGRLLLAQRDQELPASAETHYITPTFLPRESTGPARR